MATLQPTIERRQNVAAPLRRVSWGAIFAGASIAIAVLVLLGLLGIAVGATILEPDSSDSPSARAFGTGAGIWWTVSGILALFAGGWSAGRLAGLRRQWEGPLHGLVAWAVTTTALVILMGSALGAAMSGAFQVVSTGARMASGSSEFSRRAMRHMEAWTGRERREAQRPGATGQAAEERDERALSPADEQRMREAADTAADTVAVAAWWTCLFLLLTAVAAGVGGMLAAAQERVVVAPRQTSVRSPDLPVS